MDSVLLVQMLLCAWLPLLVGVPSDARTEPAVLDSVRVVGSRPIGVSAHVGFATTLPVDANEGARSLADVLDEATGVRVRRYGGLGAFASATIRGSSAGQVEVFLDGIPLNSAQWGGADLGNLAVDHLERVDVYRSGTPLGVAASGIGGAINLVTADVARTQTRVRLGGGSHGTRRASIQHVGRVAGLRALASYRHVRTDGDFPYRYDPGTPVLNDADDSERRRANNAFREQGTLVKLEHVGSDLRVHGQHEWSEKAYRIPGHGNLLYEAAHADVRRHAARVGVSRRADDTLPVEMSGAVFLTDERDRYFNPEDEPGLSAVDLVHASRHAGASLSLSASLPAYLDWQLDGTASRERFTPTELREGGEGFTRRRDHRSLRIGNRLSFGAGVLLESSLRAAAVTDDFFGQLAFGAAAAPRPEHRVDFRDVTVALRAPLAPAWTFTATRAEHHRLPTLLELFGTQGDIVPNPNLSPERGTTWDVGLTWTPRPSVSVSAAAFHATRDSLILFLQNSQRSFKATNIEASTARGVEVTAHVRLGPLSLDANGTTQDVRHEGDIPYLRGRWLPYVSPREGFARARVSTAWLEGRYDVRYLDGYYTHPANLPDQRVPSRTLHGLGVTRRLLADRVRIDLDVRNVFDETFTDVYGYPMPGRTVTLSVETVIGGAG